MTPLEMRASLGLAGIFGLRMLGMFLILPVFAIYAHTLPGGDRPMLIGLALGMYGLTQAVLQLPFGMASDRFGRKPVIYFGLVLFALGSFVAYFAHDIYWIIIGRSIQGAGAISAAITALLADLTREEHRTKAMAMIGTTIGMTFAISMAVSPLIYQAIGVPGMFALTGVLSIAAVFVVAKLIPDPKTHLFHSDAEVSTSRLSDVLKNPQLLRLNFGIFSLHAAQMSMFVIIPAALVASGNMPEQEHWKIYLPVMVIAFVLMVPLIIYGEKKGKLKNVFVFAIALLLASQLLFSVLIDSFRGVAATLLLFFTAFNILEASLPSLVSKIAPVSAKGTAMGVYNTSQSLGLFAGGAAGGMFAAYGGNSSVFIFGAAMSAIWLMLAFTMKAPPAVRTKMYPVGQLDEVSAKLLSQQLSGLHGVFEAVVIGDEGVAYLKTSMSGFDEKSVLNLVEVRA
ncbi:MAG: MFS transporter [Burkholderiales bacterium]|nr:MFS transporter [Burkholderiales bacterium]